MTKDEAILINIELLRLAKEKRPDNHRDWFGKRCALCCREVEEGQEYLSFIPIDYKDSKKLMTDLTHISCLDFKDRVSFPNSKKVASNKNWSPLLTTNLFYDIIHEKENDANSN